MKSFTLLCTFGSLLASPMISAAITIAPPDTWQIDETPATIGFDNGVLYTVTNNHETDSIIAFAVGFNSQFSAGSAFAENADGWAGESVSQAGWSADSLTSLNGVTAETFFGITWAEFQAFDAENTVTDAAVFNFLNPTEMATNVLGPASESVGASTYPSMDPVFAAVIATSASPAVVLTSGNQLSGGPAGELNDFTATSSTSAVPEPSTFALAFVGLFSLCCRSRRSRRA